MVWNLINKSSVHTRTHTNLSSKLIYNSSLYFCENRSSVKEIYNLLKARNGLDKISLGEMCDFMPPPWIRLHKRFSHGHPCDPNTKSAFAQNQQPQHSKRWARPRQGTGAEQARALQCPSAWGQILWPQGEDHCSLQRRFSAEKNRTQCYLLITNWEEKTQLSS